MQTNLKEQINAIQQARHIVGHINEDGILHTQSPSIRELSEIYKALNDAASTIASLNLTKDIPKDNPAFRIKELEEALKENNEALRNSLPYIQGAYECAFPDELQNQWVLETAQSAIEKAKSLLTNK